VNTLEIVQSVDAMTDKTKAYVKDGSIWQYGARVKVNLPINQIAKSINSDGTPYNGGQGWKTNYTLNSAGAELATNYYEVTGFIPYTMNDVFKMKGFEIDSEPYSIFCFYDKNFALTKSFPANSGYNPCTQFVQEDGTIEGSLSNLTKSNMTEAQKTATAYMRIGLKKITDDTLLTINAGFEETSEIESAEWYDTKIPYYGDVVENQGTTLASHDGIISKIRRYMGLHV